MVEKDVLDKARLIFNVLDEEVGIHHYLEEVLAILAIVKELVIFEAQE